MEEQQDLEGEQHFLFHGGRDLELYIGSSGSVRSGGGSGNGQPITHGGDGGTATTGAGNAGGGGSASYVYDATLGDYILVAAGGGGGGGGFH